MTGMGWVIGALITVLAVAMVIAGATGHAQNLLPAITGKGTSSGSSSTPTQTATQAIDAELISLNGSTPAASSSPSTTSPSSSANPYASLGQIQGVIA